MSCGNADIKIVFMESQIKVRPTQLNLRTESGKFNHVRCRMTREAGQHIHDNHKPNEPVYITSNGKNIARLFISDQEKAVEVTEKSAYLDLRDEIQILEQITIDKTFGGFENLGDVIDWLVNKSIDNQEYDVISNYEYTTSDVEEIEPYTNKSSWDSDVLNFIQNKGKFVTDPLISIVPNVEDFDLDYENVTIWEALQDISKKFGIEMFSRGTGKLYIGERSHKKRAFVAGFGEDVLNITGITLPENPNRIRSVHITGGTAIRSEKDERWSLGSDFNFRTIRAKSVNRMYPNGENLSYEFPEVTESSALRDVSRRVLIEATRNDNSGSISIDVLSSLEKNVLENIKDVTVGDAIYIEESDYCRHREIPSGMFHISGIHHKINNRVGWNVTLDISQIPNMEFVESSSKELTSEYVKDLEDIVNNDVDWVREFGEIDEQTVEDAVKSLSDRYT